MKKLSAIDLDLMEKELPVLEYTSLEYAKGGFSENNWGCVFNCMEHIGNQYGLIRDDQGYYQKFKNYFDYDPKKNDQGVRSTDDLTDFFTQAGFSYQSMAYIQNYQLNGSQMALIPIEGSSNQFHAVIPSSIENGNLRYWDPTKQKYGSISGAEVFKIYDIYAPMDNLSGYSGQDPYGSSGYLASGYAGSGSYQVPLIT